MLCISILFVCPVFIGSEHGQLMPGGVGSGLGVCLGCWKDGSVYLGCYRNTGGDGQGARRLGYGSSLALPQGNEKNGGRKALEEDEGRRTASTIPPRAAKWCHVR